MAERLSVEFHSLQIEDSDAKGRILRGGVMAIEGDFVDGRGAFNLESLKQIAKMAVNSAKGLKSRFGHPSLLVDGLGRFLGRWKNSRTATALDRQGSRVPAVRGDLHLDESSFDTPAGDLGGYVLRLATSDSDALSSSLVILPKLEARERGRPPVWYPEELAASDIVEEGAAVAGLLQSADAIRSKLHTILDKAFDDETREAMESFWTEYLDRKFGEPEPPAPSPLLAARRLKMDEMKLVLGKIRGAG